MPRIPVHLISKPFQTLYIILAVLMLSLFLPVSLHPLPAWRTFFLQNTLPATHVPEPNRVHVTIENTEKKINLNTTYKNNTNSENTALHTCLHATKALQYGYLTVPCFAPTTHALTHFQKRLEDLQKKGNLVRIAYFTDSIGSGDKITSTLRYRFQHRFGDGGPGYVAVYPLRHWHYHSQVQLLLSKGWHPRSFIGSPTVDKHYGFGGIGVASWGNGNTMRFRAKNASTFFSAAQIHFLRHPEGSVFRILVGEKLVREINTQGERHKEDFVRISFEKTTNLTIESYTPGLLRINAVFLEKTGPGVVLDAISLTGARFENWYSLPVTHVRAEMAARAPDLLMFHFGLNESDTDVESDYADRIVDFVSRIRQTIPMSCIIVAPTDTVQKWNGQWRTLPVIQKIAQLQRKAAMAAGCAFFDTIAAMGGETAIVRWYEHKPRLAMGDLTHITSEGGELLGDLIYSDILQALVNR